MRIIIDCDQAHLPTALNALQAELPGWRGRYTRVGWGWHWGRRGLRFFVRRIKEGLSVTQVDPERADEA